MSRDRNRGAGSKGLGSTRIGTMTPLGAVPKEKKGAASKLTVPKPVNLPSMKKEHAGNDPTLQLVGGHGSGTHGWSKDGADMGGAVAGGGAGRVPTLASGSTWGTMSAPAPGPSGPGMQIPSFSDRRLNPMEYPSLNQSTQMQPKPVGGSGESPPSHGHGRRPPPRWADDEREAMRMQYGHHPYHGGGGVTGIRTPSMGTAWGPMGVGPTPWTARRTSWTVLAVLAGGARTPATTATTPLAIPSTTAAAPPVCTGAPTIPTPTLTIVTTAPWRGEEGAMVWEGEGACNGTGAMADAWTTARPPLTVASAAGAVPSCIRGKRMGTAFPATLPTTTLSS